MLSANKNSTGFLQTTKHVDKVSNQSLFSTPKRVDSFGDNLVNLDHSLDQKLLELYKYIDFNQSNYKTYNPSPNEELQYFNNLKLQCHKEDMLRHNYLLRSRLFIRHAKLMQIPQQFSEKKQINILDLGCGNTPDLLGILALFGIDRVKYIGVDEDCSESKKVYDNLINESNITFICEDAREFLLREEYKNLFDLVLIQHPIFQFDFFQPIFSEIFQKASNVISSGGILYSTIYMQKESDYFAKEVLPLMPEMEGYKLIKSDSFQEEAKSNLGNGVIAAPEQFIFISPPLNLQLLNKLDFESRGLRKTNGK